MCVCCGNGGGVLDIGRGGGDIETWDLVTSISGSLLEIDINLTLAIILCLILRTIFKGNVKIPLRTIFKGNVKMPEKGGKNNQKLVTSQKNTSLFIPYVSVKMKACPSMRGGVSINKRQKKADLIIFSRNKAFL